MNIKSIFSNLINKASLGHEPNGALIDYRNDEETKKDYRHEEIFASSEASHLTDYDRVINQILPAFRENISVHNQNGAGSCVAHALASLCAIFFYLDHETRAPKFSARWIYPRRMNRPQEGMHFIDACNLVMEHGNIFDLLVPGDNKTELEMQELPEKDYKLHKAVAAAIKSDKYIWLPHNFDAFAKILNTVGLPILMGVRFSSGEWSGDMPIIKNSDTTNGHAITAVPFTATTLPNGKRAFLIIDSWGINNGMKGFRWVTEDWFNNQRILAGIYFINMVKDDHNESVLPKYTFSQDLCWGMQNNSEVYKLQEALAALKYFDHSPTGNFFGITLKAVKDFQIAQKIEPVSGYVGPLTRAALNKILNK
jgi:hypothetical protein